ncbi:hypothetical protein vseg_007474 [Gypsophila vaccaria]
MARKTTIQRHRKLTLRGRSITGTQDEDNNITETRAEGEAIPVSTTKPKGPNEEDVLKSKNIHDIIGLQELHIESDEVEEGEVQEISMPERRTESKLTALILNHLCFN